MKLEFEIPDEALLDFGKAAIEQEVQDSLKWLQKPELSTPSV